MKIVVAVRCYNEEKHIPRFMKGYDFADTIVVSDGGSTDNSVEMLREFPKVHLLHFDQKETVNGQTWNPDHPHMNFVLDAAKELNPTFLVFDDMDCVPSKHLRENARDIFQEAYELQLPQINTFRLYLWGETGFYFPHMNRYFNERAQPHEDFRSLWAWRPEYLSIHADPGVRHGTLVNLAGEEATMKLRLPYVLLHRSWYPDTIQAKVDRYNALELPMHHPIEHPDEFGVPERLPDWAVE